MVVLAFCNGVERGPPGSLRVRRDENIEFDSDQRVACDAERGAGGRVRVEDLTGIGVECEEDVGAALRRLRRTS